MTLLNAIKNDVPEHAKVTIARVEKWLAGNPGRDIETGWKWNTINRHDRTGIFKFVENGDVKVARNYYRGDMNMPNPDFRKTNTGSFRHKALISIMKELEA